MKQLLESMKYLLIISFNSNAFIGYSEYQQVLLLIEIYLHVYSRAVRVADCVRDQIKCTLLQSFGVTYHVHRQKLAYIAVKIRVICLQQFV